MKNLLLFLIPIIFFTSCHPKKKEKVGICCEKTYANVDDAWECFSQTASTENTHDDRVLLVAFVDKNLEKNQNLGWNIIKDPEIIKEAKRKYALVIIDKSETKNFPNERLVQSVKEHFKQNSEKPIFFGINSLKHHFNEWTLDDDDK